MTVLQDRVKAQNVMTNHINKIVPLFLKRFESKVAYKNDGKPMKKHKGDFDAILEDLPPKMRALIGWGTNSISIKFDIHYPTGNFGCEYIDQYVYLYDHNDEKTYSFEPFELITEKTITDAQKELVRLEKLSLEIAHDISRTKRILNK